MSTRARRGGRASGTTTNGRTPNQTQVEATGEATPVPTGYNFAAICKDFATLGGKTFKGTESITEVQDWLYFCERIFLSLKLTDEQKRLLASWQLEGAAAAWWRAQTANVPEEDFSWEKFKEEFEAQFLPATGRTRMYREFMDLKQEDMSVTEYETKFNALSCFGPELINTPLKKNEMFVTGLKESLHEKMIGHLKGSFVDLVDMALRYEALDKKKSAETTQVGETGETNPQKRKFNPNWKNGKGTGGNSKNIVCHNCKKRGHIARFCRNSGIEAQQPTQQQQPEPKNEMVLKTLCYNCHQPGHMVRECPLMKKANPAKVYAIKNEPSASSDVKGKEIVKGTLLWDLYSCLVRYWHFA